MLMLLQTRSVRGYTALPLELEGNTGSPSNSFSPFSLQNWLLLTKSSIFSSIRLSRERPHSLAKCISQLPSHDQLSFSSPLATLCACLPHSYMPKSLFSQFLFYSFLPHFSLPSSPLPPSLIRTNLATKLIGNKKPGLSDLLCLYPVSQVTLLDVHHEPGKHASEKTKQHVSAHSQVLEPQTYQSSQRCKSHITASVHSWYYCDHTRIECAWFTSLTVKLPQIMD